MPFARHPLFLSLLLGAAAACGFAPLDLWPLLILAFAGWSVLVARAPTGRAALWRGYWFGLGHFTVNNNWFQHAFDFQDKMPPVLGYFAAVALAVYLAVFPAAAAIVAWRFRGRAVRGRPGDPAFALALGAAWITTEWLRGHLFTGYAWDPVAVTWVPLLGVARAAALVGTYALSGLTMLLAALLPAALAGRWRPAAAGLALVAVLAVSEPWTRAPDADPAGPRVRTVQPNIGNEARVDAAERSFETLVRLSGRAGPAPRLVLWPEGLVTDLLEGGYPDYIYADRDPYRLRARAAAVLGPGDLLLTNAPRLFFDDRGRLTGAANSVLAIDPGTRIAGRYDKAHLVPYGEYLPMPWLLRPLGLARLVPGDMDFTPGPGPRSIPWPGVGAVGLQVCYEIIFSGEVAERGLARPRLIFNPSNDAWFGRWGPPQHLAQARLRAAEEGLPVIRSTPTGISAIVAADGRLLASVPADVAGAAERPLPPALAPTPFARVGNWAALIVALLLAVGAVASRRRGR